MSKYTLEFVDSPLSKDMEKTETNSGDGETYHQLQMETKLNYIQKTRKYKNMDTYEVRNSMSSIIRVILARIHIILKNTIKKTL